MRADDTPSESGYTDVDSAADPSQYVRRLDEVGTGEFWRSVKERTYALLDLRVGSSVLDVGCGTGDDVRALSYMVGPAGHSVGVDSSFTMIAEARSRAEASGLNVEFYQCAAQQLHFRDESFDACRAERLLQHLHDPERAFTEMVRVTRPGGRVMVVEPDYGTESICGADRAVTLAILKARCAHFRSGKIGRDLPRFFKAIRATEITTTVLSLEGGDIAQEGELLTLQKYVAAAQKAGVVSVNAGISWLADLQAAGKAGRYRRAISIFLVSGRKPA